MRLRHVLLLTSSAGAIGALLLAFDIHHRFRIAQRDSIVNNIPPAPDSVMIFGEPYLLGLVSLAFLFIGIFLMIISTPEKSARPEAKAQTKPVEKPVAETPAVAPVVATLAAAPAPDPVPVPLVEATPVEATPPLPIPTEQPVPATTDPDATTPN